MNRHPHTGGRPPGPVHNETDNDTWTDDDGLTYTELIRQEYKNIAFSGGAVAGHPHDSLWIRAERWQPPGDPVPGDIMLLLRPDEVAAINWVCSGLLFSDHIAHPRRKRKGKHGQETSADGQGDPVGCENASHD